MKTLLALALFSMPLFSFPQLETSPAGVSEKKKGGHRDGGQKKDEEEEETFAVAGETPVLTAPLA